jgi:hypothetical protein
MWKFNFSAADEITVVVSMAGTPGTSHYYAVKAVNAFGEKSDPSNIVGEFDAQLQNAK